MRGSKRKNLALDALQKLLNGEIRSRAKTNIVECRTFSRGLEDAIARYHANAIFAVEMINELIALAKDLQKARRRGEDQGLSQEEIAFYDALAQNESAIQALGNDTLRVIEHELLEQLEANATVDWHKRESAMTLAVEVIDNVQQTECPAVFKAIRHKIHGPDCVGLIRHSQHVRLFPLHPFAGFDP
jgi:type I restriction enzyme, R subunit